MCIHILKGNCYFPVEEEEEVGCKISKQLSRTGYDQLQMVIDAAAVCQLEATRVG